MKDGRIVEEGTHQTLLDSGNGEYANLRRSYQTSTDDALRKCEEKASKKNTCVMSVRYWLYIS